MRVLLDTHAFLWWVEDAPTLTRRAKAVVANPTNECLLSLVSCWEMAIKIGLEDCPPLLGAGVLFAALVYLGPAAAIVSSAPEAPMQ